MATVAVVFLFKLFMLGLIQLQFNVRFKTSPPESTRVNWSTVWSKMVRTSQHESKLRSTVKFGQAVKGSQWFGQLVSVRVNASQRLGQTRVNSGQQRSTRRTGNKLEVAS
ncbi:hypothetical protein HanPSC8_Chr15g0692141 [Helianthus annuus]|nr:hypothetical protein HanPSC8_Chr15g0692141 [Helianthus annuus]